MANHFNWPRIRAVLGISRCACHIRDYHFDRHNQCSIASGLFWQLALNTLLILI
jgi:hypothetical protein